MNTKSQKFKVRLGLFIAGGFILFALAIFLIGKQKNLFNPVFKLTTTFFNVGGLQVGNNIRFSGINVGTVDNIVIINDSTVQVDMLIRKSIQPFIKQDCMATIGSEGIIGDRVLIITQGSAEAPIVKSGQYLLSREPVEMDALMESLHVVAGNAEIITAQLAEIMTNINQGEGPLGRLIKDTVVAENISETIENFKKTSQGIDNNMEVIMLSFIQTADNVALSSSQLADMVISINQGNGTIGRLIQDTIMSDNISKTVVNLEKGTKGLNESIEALKHSFLFRGYFKRKAKRDEKARQDSLKLEMINNPEMVE